MAKPDEFDVKFLMECYFAKVSDLIQLGADQKTIDDVVKTSFSPEDLEVIKNELKRMEDDGKFKTDISILGQRLHRTSPENEYKELAEKFIADNPIFYDSSTKIWWMWNDRVWKWQMVEDVDILRRFTEKYQILKWLNQTIQNMTLTALKVFAKNKPLDLPLDWIQFKDYFYDINTGEKYPVDSKYFTTNPIEWSVGSSEETPTMDRLFEEWVGKDKVPFLYEFLAFLPYRKYEFNKIFINVGIGRNGKSTFTKLVIKFIGTGNMTTSSLDDLINSRFETGKLLNKLLCIISELDIGILQKSSKLKALTGEDPMRYEFKNKNPSDGFSYAKLMMMGNTFPEIEDKSDGMVSRFIWTDFPNQFDIEKNRDVLKEIPDAEYENLARKCLRLLKELLERRYFIGEGNIAHKRRVLEEKTDLLRRFIEEHYEFDPDGTVWRFDFGNKFDIFCKNKNISSWSSFMVNEKLKKDFGLELRQKKFTDLDGEVKNWVAIFGLHEKSSKDKTEEEKTTLDDFAGARYDMSKWV